VAGLLVGGEAEPAGGEVIAAATHEERIAAAPIAGGRPRFEGTADFSVLLVIKPLEDAVLAGEIRGECERRQADEEDAVSFDRSLHEINPFCEPDTQATDSAHRQDRRLRVRNTFRRLRVERTHYSLPR
jgi:hypothetical protein